MCLVISVDSSTNWNSHVQKTPYCYPRRTSDSRCDRVEALAVVDTAYTAEIVVDMMIAGIDVEVLETCIPWVGSCSRSKGEIR
jgi:hypothetical protein